MYTTTTKYYDIDFQQKGQWLINKTCPQNPFVLSRTVELVDVDLEALRATMQLLVKLNECLRTRFVVESGIIKHEVVSPEEINFEIEFVDLSKKVKNNGKVCDNSLKIQINKASVVLFQLDKLPLFSIKVFHHSNKYLLVFVVSHAFFDPESLNYFEKSFVNIYNDLLKQEDLKIPEPDLQLKDYYLKNQKLLDGNYGNEIRAYWKSQFATDRIAYRNGNLASEYLKEKYKKLLGSAFTSVSNDMDIQFLMKSLPVFDSNNAAISLTFPFSKTQQSSLNRLLMDNQVSPFLFILATLSILWYNHEALKSFIVGFAVSDRLLEADFRHTIGWLLSSAYLVCDMNKNLSFSTYLKDLFLKWRYAVYSSKYPLDLILRDNNLIIPQNFLVPLYINFRARGKLKTIPRKTTIEHHSVNNVASPINLYCRASYYRDYMNIFCEYKMDAHSKSEMELFFKNYSIIIEKVISNQHLKLRELALNI